MQYKNWGSDKQENWKPVSPDPEQWLTIVKVSGAGNLVLTTGLKT